LVHTLSGHVWQFAPLLLTFDIALTFNVAKQSACIAPYCRDNVMESTAYI